MEIIENEIWKQIPDHNGYYASNFGRIKSYRSNGGKIVSISRILKEIKTEKGYRRVAIRKNKKPRIWFTHRLIALAFIGRSDLEINHKNCIKSDNRIENLEYVTRSQNEIHAYKNNLKSKKGENHHQNKITEEQARKIKYEEFSKHKEIAVKYGISSSQVCHIKKGKSWSYL